MNTQLPYRNRQEAGRILARYLDPYAGRQDVIALGLARGGIPVAYEIAVALGVPLGILIVRKLGVPGQEELAMGAIASDGVCVLNRAVTTSLNHPEVILRKVLKQEQQELKRREKQYGDEYSMADGKGKTVILTDDGLATGMTMRAALQALKRRGAVRCVVAVPVGSPDTCSELQHEADEVICIATPEPFYGVGQFYEDFSQTSDEEVRDLLTRAANRKIPEPPIDRSV